MMLRPDNNVTIVEGMVLRDKHFSYKVSKVEHKANRVILERSDGQKRPIRLSVIQTMLTLNDVRAD